MHMGSGAHNSSDTTAGADSRVDTNNEDGLRTVWLTRERRANALSEELVTELIQHVDDATASDTKVLVIRAHGSAFCSGLDLAELKRETDASLVRRFHSLQRLLDQLTASPFVTCAVAQGPAVGAGADLFAACDLRLASPDARFRFPGPGFGAVLGTRRLARLVGPAYALEAAVTGSWITALEALGRGLATHLLDDDDPSEVISRIVAGLGA